MPSSTARLPALRLSVAGLALVRALTPPAARRHRLGSAGAVVATTAAQPDEQELLSALRAGDEGAFRQLVARHHGGLMRLARTFGADDAVAEEIAQETWLAALQSLDRFEARSSVKAWLFGILKHQARRRSAREKRMVPFSALAGEDGDVGPIVDALRFQGEGTCWPDHWAVPPRPWDDGARRLAALETRRVLRTALEGLPPRQRAVVALRDVEGLTAEEACGVLDLGEGNQRVLLHRGRSAVRAALEEHLDA